MRVFLTILGACLVLYSGVVAQDRPGPRASHPVTGRENILRLLDQIVLKQVKFESLPLTTVVDFLQQRARLHDPEKRGVDFFIDGNGATSSPLARAVVNIDPPLKNIRLRDVLQGVVELSSVPIEVSIRDDGVLFSAMLEEPLITRTFEVNPAPFIQAVQEVSGMRLDPVRTGGLGDNRMGLMQNLQQLVRHFFSAAGVDFPPLGVEKSAGGLTTPLTPNKPKSDGKAIFFNDRTGLLFVRATSSDMDILEQVIAVVAAQQVELDIRILEIKGGDTRALGFDWFAGQHVGPTDLQRLPIAQPFGAGQGRILGICTESQYRVIRRAMDQRGGIRSMNVRITAVSGRQERVSFVRVSGETDGDTPALVPPSGSVTFVAKVLEDGYTIEVRFSLRSGSEPTIKESLLDLPLKPVDSPGHVAGQRRIWDGQTLAIEGDVARDWRIADDNERPEFSGVAPRRVILMTFSIIDPTGLETRGDLPFDPNSFPAQE